MSDEERRNHIPTPEELETGEEIKSKRRAVAEPDAKAGESESFTQRLRRRLGVGRRRSFVQPEPPEETPAGAPPAMDPEEADVSVRRKGPQVSPASNVAATPVESISVRRRRTEKKSKPVVLPPREKGFYEAAAKKGHKMGELAHLPHFNEYRAECSKCGETGSIAIQTFDNWPDTVTNYVYRGRAIERTCLG